jgi:hypothetical protein
MKLIQRIPKENSGEDLVDSNKKGAGVIKCCFSYITYAKVDFNQP